MDAGPKWAALELMLGSSTSVVALAKKMAKPDIKPITRTVSIPKTKTLKQPAQQQTVGSANDVVRTGTKSITPQKPLPSQRANQKASENHSIMHSFMLRIVLDDIMTDWDSETGKRCLLARLQ